jgi:hypothetical protein
VIRQSDSQEGRARYLPRRWFRSAGFLCWLVTALAGCAPTNRIFVATNQSLGGTLAADRFDLLPGATVTLTGDLTINARGDIHIDGNLEPDQGAAASIYLRSEQGNIYIDGRIRAGNGANKPLVEAPGTAIAEAGGPGGSITLVAQRSSVYVRGSLESGQGGQGGFARAMGSASLIFAEGGSGGPAGKIIIQAGDIIDVTGGTIHGGAAGNGGWAVAQFANVPSIDTSIAVGTAIAPKDRELLDAALERLQRAPEPVRTRAVSGMGGGGGVIELQLSTAGREILLQGAIEGGIGGNGGEAKARLGHGATAISQNGGLGGDVKLNASPVQLFVLTPPKAGRGRNADRALAFAINTALAVAGSGGHAGQVLEQGLKVGSAEAGDGGAAVAQTFNPALRRSESPRMHSGDMPGGTAQAAIP